LTWERLTSSWSDALKCQSGMQPGDTFLSRNWATSTNPAVIRQQMGHASAAMTALYTGELPLEDVRTEFRLKFGAAIHALEMGGDSSVNPCSRIKALQASVLEELWKPRN
jgi:hypothetical protein